MVTVTVIFRYGMSYMYILVDTYSQFTLTVTLTVTDTPCLHIEDYLLPLAQACSGHGWAPVAHP